MLITAVSNTEQHTITFGSIFEWFGGLHIAGNPTIHLHLHNIIKASE
jgi:hypothetical protein